VRNSDPNPSSWGDLLISDTLVFICSSVGFCPEQGMRCGRNKRELITLAVESSCQCRGHKRCGFDPWIGKIPGRRKWQPTPVFLPGKFHGQRSLAGSSPWGNKAP